MAEFLAEGGCPDKALHAELEAAAAAVEVAREGLRALDADALEELRVADSPPSAPVREAVERLRRCYRCDRTLRTRRRG